MNNSGEKEQNNRIVKFIGRPTNLQSEVELTKWKRFLKFIWPWAKEGGKLISRGKELTEDFYQAEVDRKSKEADKFAAEAANIAAEKDLKIQQKVKVVNEEITRIFSDNNVPDLAKQLQLANLIANNPEISAQLDKIEEVVSKLKAVNFSKFNLEIEEDTSNLDAEEAEFVDETKEDELNLELDLPEDEKTEPTEEEVQRQVRETLEKLKKPEKE
ncbi:hypothetical protein [Euzebyella saccharophila]|uniref:Uncharacterized protein n=1 Tax=Euzebyella saccharophila TaxID=679664 RepID=A0ABV8JRC5_9FLAO|nr:hypothetical protein [Euzebyella saccharophila]